MGASWRTAVRPARACVWTGATSYAGAVVTRYYDSLLVKITTRGRDHDEVSERMARALLEFRIRGVETNLPFLQHLIAHPKFLDGSYNTQFIDTQGSLFKFPKKRDRATKLLKFVGDVIVNGNPEVAGRKVPAVLRYPKDSFGKIIKLRYLAIHTKISCFLSHKSSLKLSHKNDTKYYKSLKTL